MITGDTDTTPYGGGTWASRGAGIGGEAACRPAWPLRGNVLEVAGAMLQATPETLDIVNGEIVETRERHRARMPLAELGRIVYFRADTLPPTCSAELMQTRHFHHHATSPSPSPTACRPASSRSTSTPASSSCSSTGAWRTAARVINPLLVDEQVRGGIVQGIGGALLRALHLRRPRASC